MTASYAFVEGVLVFDEEGMLPASFSQSLPPSSLTEAQIPMERIRQIFKSRPAYKPLEPEDRGEADSLIQRDGEERVPSEHEEHEGNDIASQPDDCAGVKSFLWIEYYIFTLLGVAMLWTW